MQFKKTITLKKEKKRTGRERDRERERLNLICHNSRFNSLPPTLKKDEIAEK